MCEYCICGHCALKDTEASTIDLNAGDDGRCLSVTPDDCDYYVEDGDDDNCD